MSHFYGTLQGQRGEATRCGSRSSGLVTNAASWNGAIQVELYVDAQGRDCYRIHERTWRGAGKHKLIAEGVIGNQPK